MGNRPRMSTATELQEKYFEALSSDNRGHAFDVIMREEKIPLRSHKYGGSGPDKDFSITMEIDLRQKYETHRSEEQKSKRDKMTWWFFAIMAFLSATASVITAMKS